MYTQEDLQNVKKAINELASGKSVAKITYPNGEMIEYTSASMKELFQLRSLIESEVNSTTGLQFFKLRGAL